MVSSRKRKAPPEPLSARTKIEAIVGHIDAMLADAAKDGSEWKPRDKIALLTAATNASRLLLRLTGETAPTVAELSKSSVWRQMVERITEALKPFPEAAQAVADAIEGNDT